MDTKYLLFLTFVIDSKINKNFALLIAQETLSKLKLSNSQLTTHTNILNSTLVYISPYLS